jgi:hypothetical protein
LLATTKEQTSAPTADYFRRRQLQKCDDNPWGQRTENQRQSRSIGIKPEMD